MSRELKIFRKVQMEAIAGTALLQFDLPMDCDWFCEGFSFRLQTITVSGLIRCPYMTSDKNGETAGLIIGQARTGSADAADCYWTFGNLGSDIQSTDSGFAAGFVVVPLSQVIIPRGSRVAFGVFRGGAADVVTGFSARFRPVQDPKRI